MEICCQVVKPIIDKKISPVIHTMNDLNFQEIFRTKSYLLKKHINEKKDTGLQ